MAANEETLGKLSVKIEADMAKWSRDMDSLKTDAKKNAEEIEKEFRKKKIKFDDTLAKKSVNELIALRKKLEAQFEKTLKLNISPNAMKQVTSQIKSELDSVNKALKDVGASVDKTQSKFAQVWSKIPLLIAKAAVVMYAFKKALDFAKEAAQLNSLGVTFQRLAKTEGLNAVELMKQLKSSTKGAVEEIELLRIANKGKFLGVDMQALPSLMEFASLRAKQTGESINYLVDSIVIGLGRKSPLILDNLGLTMAKLDAAVIKVAADHGKVITKVDELARSQYLVEAATRVAREEIQAAGGVIEDLNTKVDQLGTKWDAVTKKLGDFFIPVFTRVLGIVEAGIDGISALAREIQNLGKDISNVPELDFKTGERNSADALNQIGKGKRTFYKDGRLVTVQLIANEEKSRLDTNAKIEKELEFQVLKLKDLVRGSKEFKDTNAEILRLTKLLTNDEEKQKNVIDEMIKKLQTENEIRSLTYTLSTDILEASRAMLEAQLAIVTTDEDRLKILREIKRVEEEIARISPDFSIEELDSGTFAEDLNKEIAKGIEDKQAAEAEALSYLQELRLQNMGSEFDEREARINAEYDMMLEKYAGNAEIITEIEKAREKELAKLSLDRFNAGLNAAQNIASALRTVFGDTQLIQTFTEVLSIVEAIAAIMQAIGILGAVFGGPVGAVAAVPKAAGGPVERNKVYKVGERGEEWFVPRTSGTIIPNHEIRTKVVQPSEIRTLNSGGQEKYLEGINQRLNILISNFVESTLQKPKQSAIPLFGKLDGKDIFISNKRSGKVIGRMT